MREATMARAACWLAGVAVMVWLAPWVEPAVRASLRLLVEVAR